MQHTRSRHTFTSISLQIKQHCSLVKVPLAPPRVIRRGRVCIKTIRHEHARAEKPKKRTDGRTAWLFLHCVIKKTSSKFQKYNFVQYGGLKSCYSQTTDAKRTEDGRTFLQMADGTSCKQCKRLETFKTQQVFLWEQPEMLIFLPTWS